jgi:hypothetical protein
MDPSYENEKGQGAESPCPIVFVIPAAFCETLWETTPVDLD